MVGIVDYNAGNITSVARALERLGVPHVVSKNPRELQACSKLIFPGVGDASYAMGQLTSSGFASFLKDSAQSGRLILGICLGSQVIFEHSDEGNTDCLGLLPGCVRSFRDLFLERGVDPIAFKVPHMGWNDLSLTESCPLLAGVDERASFYFVHSYVICPQDESIVKASADYGVKVPAIVQQGNVAACQFHPEKSGEEGLKILANFCRDGFSF